MAVSGDSIGLKCDHLIDLVVVLLVVKSSDPVRVVSSKTNIADDHFILLD